MHVRGRDYEYGDDLPIHRGDANGIDYPLTDEQLDELDAEIQERMARRRPCGFTAKWPEDDGDKTL